MSNICSFYFYFLRNKNDEIKYFNNLLYNISKRVSPFSSENTIIGNARVIDADTIVIKEKNRLFGIDAPELNQKCLDNRSKHYNCGKEVKRISNKNYKKIIL